MTIPRMMLAAVSGALLFLGCSSYVINISPVESPSAKFQCTRKGNIHIIPMGKGPFILQVESGHASPQGHGPQVLESK
jgi:hypothetical protein